jgi:hypothetical protein
MLTSCMKITVLNLEQRIWIGENLALFGRPVDRDAEISLMKSGLSDARIRAGGCLGWIWGKWLSGASKEEIRSTVEPFVERGLELRARSKSYDTLPLHDLLLLNCAIFGSSEAQLKMVAERVADAAGDKNETPLDNGELFAAAWCGTLKHWIRGDYQKATQQSELVWGAYREHNVSTASKPLVVPWLNRDWAKFKKAQEKDLEKLWVRARKNGTVIGTSDDQGLVMTTDKYYVMNDWCWSHCGLALLAHRHGADVATDPFWFPPNALD